MSTKFKTVITTAGAAKLAAATMPGGKKINLNVMAVGDGGGKLPDPEAGQTQLVNEVWRHTLNKISQDNRYSNYIVAELVIPPEVGGFWMRELGLYDDEGTLIAVANMAESYKPELAEGSGRAQTCRMVIIVSSVESVELSIDSTMVMATQDYVDDRLAEHEKSRRHPDATLKEKGFTQLSNATDSESETLAATPKAVKAAYDLADAKYTAQDATTTRKGLVQLSNATDSVSETLAATPKAVKVAYDIANAKYTAQDATTMRKGLVQLSNATDSTSETLAATPKAVKAAMDNANGRLAKNSNGGDIPDKGLFAQNISAALAFSGGIHIGGDSNPWTTAEFIAWLESQGAFNHRYWMCRGSWSYADNKTITDTGCGNICLAGAVVEVMGFRGATTIRVTTPTTTSGGGVASAQFTYIDNGGDYSPGWRRDFNTINKPTAGDVGALPVTGGRLNGPLGIGTDNGLGGNSIVLGDNDTGFKQDGDGILGIYANNARVGYIDNSGLHMSVDVLTNGGIRAGDGKRLSLTSNNNSTMSATFNLWGDVNRPTVIELDDDQGWQ
ncbi:phage tail protein, partial [Salmonella enterica subsp. enterica serovar Gaminara]|nr:phage tail protein [Salmonella enterica subsp. enterica serovar Gaminara]